MKKLRLLFISFGVILCTTLAACTPRIQAPESIVTNHPKQICQILLQSIVSSKGTNLRFILRRIAANQEYVFFRTVAPATSGHISVASAEWKP